MNFWKNIIRPILLGKKTVTKLEVGHFDVRIAIIPGISDPSELNKERLDTLLKEALQEALLKYLVEKASEVSE